MDISKAFVCALLVLLGLLGAHGVRVERSTGGASSGAGSYAGSMSGSSYNDDFHRKIQAQNKAIQAQIERQIYEQQQAFDQSAWATSSASMYNDDGLIDPNAQMYAMTYTSPVYGLRPGSFDHLLNGAIQQSSIPLAQNRPGVGSRNGVNSGFPGFPGFDGFGDNSGFGLGGFPSGGSSGSGGSFDHDGPASAISSVSVGPQGGYQAGEISPVAPGISSRFGEDVDPPSGGNVAVFSSSSSSQSVGPDGKVVSHKSSTTGVNDNGKVSIKTVHDP